MLSRQQKKEIIESLAEKFKKAKSVILTDFAGLNVKDMQALRQALRENDSQYQVIKKTLLSLAFKKAGLELDVRQFKGNVAFGFSEADALAPAKILYDFSKEHGNLKLLGGILVSPDELILNHEEVIALAQTSSKEESMARVLGSLSAPLQNFVYCLKANLSKLVYLLKQRATEDK